MPDFLTRLTQPGVILADGATGTMLQRAGLKRGMAPERWNLENPEAVQALHQSYIDAGAQAILTNTFGGTRFRLEREGLAERIPDINRTAAQLARQAASKRILVLGDIGPSGKLLKPLGPLTYAEAVDGFAEQAQGLAQGGVDAILIETMSDPNEARAAVEGVRRVTDLPVIVSFSFDTKGRTMMGVKPEAAARQTWELGVTMLGANCGRTLTETLTAIQAIRQAIPEAPLLAKPNAGLPHTQDGETVFDVTPEVMAEYALQFAAAGVKIFGGCCGSTPDHIRAVKAAFEAQAA